MTEQEIEKAVDEVVAIASDERSFYGTISQITAPSNYYHHWGISQGELLPPNEFSILVSCANDIVEIIKRFDLRFGIDNLEMNEERVKKLSTLDNSKDIYLFFWRTISTSADL